MKKIIFFLGALLLLSSNLYAQYENDLKGKDTRVMPFNQYVDMPARPLPKKDKYPYTQHFYTYTLWDSIETTMNLYAQQQWGDYSFIWNTETGVCKIGDQEFGPNNNQYSEGAYLYSSDSVSFFYSKPLKEYYQKLLHQPNANTPLLLPTGFFEGVKKFNETKYIGHIESITPLKMWVRQLGEFDTVLVANGNMDADPEAERIVAFHIKKIDNQGYQTYRLLVCNKGEDKRWYAHSAIDVTNFEGVEFDAKHHCFVIKHDKVRGGTGQGYHDWWNDIYKWHDGKISKPLMVYWERDHDTDVGSPYFFDRDHRAHYKWLDEKTVEVTDSIRLYGSVWLDEELVDKSTYVWQPETMEFLQTSSTAWERPPHASRFDTVNFHLYTRWDSLPATVVRQWSINPLIRGNLMARHLENEWYMINGKQYDYHFGECSSFIYNPKYKYNDMSSYSCELKQQIAEWNSPVNAPSPIPISEQFLYYVTISKNVDTLMSLAPLKHWYYLIADADRPEIDQVKRMESWEANIDEDPEPETIWFVFDGMHINAVMLIIDRLGGKPYLTSVVDIAWYNRLPKPKVDPVSKLITVTCPKGIYEDVQFYKYLGGQLKKVLDLQGGIEIGGLRQELQMAYLVKNETKIEVYYTYNLFYEKTYPYNEAMKLGFLNNKETKVTFEYNGSEFVQTKATPALPATHDQKNNNVMGAYLHLYQAELEEIRDKGEPSQSELLKLYLNEYLRKFAIE